MVDKYKSLNGGMFMCFLDASKAFDRVKHSVLFNKLTRRGIPGYIVKLLSYWYAKQTMRVRWGDCISSPFRVSNGVRHGLHASNLNRRLILNNPNENKHTLPPFMQQKTLPCTYIGRSRSSLTIKKVFVNGKETNKYGCCLL